MKRRRPLSLPAAGHLLSSVFRNILAPPHCAACNDALEQTAVFCTLCCRSLICVPKSQPPPHGEMAFGEYGGALAQAIARFKYGQRPDLGGPLASLLLRASSAAPPPDRIVPVPLHPKRLRWRGYNQSALLATAVARHVERPLGHLLKRRHHTTTQTSCETPKQRWQQVHAAFAVQSRTNVAGQRIWLVDDVRTTGATATACARTLLRAGAAQVQLLVLAIAGSRTFW